MLEPRINSQIRASQVRLIDENGSQLGIKPLVEALAIAQTKGWDLVEIAPTAQPPVCKIIDYSKFRYQREKKIKESRKHQRAGQVKEVRFSPKISTHDFETKLRTIDRFLTQRDKVRVVVFFRGRELEHNELGVGLLKRVQEHLGKQATLEQEPQLNGNRLIMILAPPHH